MSITKQEARQELGKLVAKYQNLTPAAIKKYTEADTRRIFVLPLFHALGWDVQGCRKAPQANPRSRVSET